MILLIFFAVSVQSHSFTHKLTFKNRSIDPNILGRSLDTPTAAYIDPVAKISAVTMETSDTIFYRGAVCANGHFMEAPPFASKSLAEIFRLAFERCTNSLGNAWAFFPDKNQNPTVFNFRMIKAILLHNIRSLSPPSVLHHLDKKKFMEDIAENEKVYFSRLDSDEKETNSALIPDGLIRNLADLAVDMFIEANVFSLFFRSVFTEGEIQVHLDNFYNIPKRIHRGITISKITVRCPLSSVKVILKKTEVPEIESFRLPYLSLRETPKLFLEQKWFGFRHLCGSNDDRERDSLEETFLNVQRAYGSNVTASGF